MAHSNAAHSGQPGTDLTLGLDILPEYATEVDVDALGRVLEKALVEQNVHGSVELSVLITNDRQVHELNRQFRNVDAPTDVLSFSQLEGENDFPQPTTGARPLGDIVISYDRVRSQAVEYGHSEKRELAYLAVHGLLHLLGFDHETEVDKQRMRQAEEQALDGIPRG